MVGQVLSAVDVKSMQVQIHKSARIEQERLGRKPNSTDGVRTVAEKSEFDPFSEQSKSSGERHAVVVPARTS